MGISTRFHYGLSKYAGVPVSTGENTTVTKKHFEELADALRHVAEHPQDYGNQYTDTDTYLACCRAVALVCEQSNPRFNRVLFLLACAPEQETT